MSTDVPLIFPVGHYLGALQSVPGVDRHVVRIGWETYPLEGTDQFRLWALAHGLPEGTDMQPWTRTTLEGAARATGTFDAAAILADLLARDLVVEVTPGTPQSVELAQTIRLRNLQAGFGNSPDAPLEFGIGLAGAQPMVRVPRFGYELWSWGPACASLWDVCQIMARSGAETDPGDRERTDPVAILTRCLLMIQVLIAHGVAYLDEAAEDWAQPVPLPRV